MIFFLYRYNLVAFSSVSVDAQIMATNVIVLPVDVNRWYDTKTLRHVKIYLAYPWSIETVNKIFLFRTNNKCCYMNIIHLLIFAIKIMQH